MVFRYQSLEQMGKSMPIFLCLLSPFAQNPLVFAIIPNQSTILPYQIIGVYETFIVAMQSNKNHRFLRKNVGQS